MQKMKIDPSILDTHLDTLRLPFLKDHCQPLAATAAKNSLSHLDYLAQLIAGEANLRADRAVARRIQAARFPVVKTLDTFRWDWPKKINRLQIQDLFRLQFVHDHANVILLGTVGLGKTHLATALGYAACQQGMSVLFANAIDVINTLHAAQTKGTLKTELRKYTNPALLILDEIGYLPIDQRRRARDAKWLLTFYALSPHAEFYHQQLKARHLNELIHINKIVALTEIHGTEKVALAIEDAIQSQAYSSQYIENILEQRARHTPTPGPLHLTRRADLLDLELPTADLTPYDII
jgi:DNA replication protein DnaC